MEIILVFISQELREITPNPFLGYGKNYSERKENKKMTRKSFLWLLAVAFVSYVGIMGVLDYQSAKKPLQLPYGKLRCLPVDELVQKLETGAGQEKIDAAAILGLERSHELKENHVVALVETLKNDYGSLGFQCAYALLKMGKKAQSAIPALEKLAQTYQGKFAHHIIEEALRSLISGISPEDAESVSKKIFQAVSFMDEYEDGVHMRRGIQFKRGLLEKVIFSHEFDRRHPAWLQISKLKEYNWVCLDVTDDAQVNIIVLPSSDS